MCYQICHMCYQFLYICYQMCHICYQIVSYVLSNVSYMAPVQFPCVTPPRLYLVICTTTMCNHMPGWLSRAGAFMHIMSSYLHIVSFAVSYGRAPVICHLVGHSSPRIMIQIPFSPESSLTPHQQYQHADKRAPSAESLFLSTIQISS